MFGKVNWQRSGFALALGLGSAVALSGGGFWISLNNPAASSDPQAKGSLVMVRSEGCADPGKSVITGTAEGLVNGRRQSVPLKLVPLSQPGVYVVKREWPEEGAWVLTLVGTYMGHNRTALVRIGPDGFERKSIKMFPRLLTKEELESYF